MHFIRLIFLLAAIMGGAVVSPAANGQTASATARTGKERLSDKASDEQRVNDCKVPPAKRTRVRPTDCR
jgi:hypothetical protein